MNEHFCNVGEKLQAEIPDYGLKYMEYMPPRTANYFYLEPVTSEDIMTEIKIMKPIQSQGHDLIVSKVIKLCPGIFAYNLAKIYNWSIENGIYPDDYPDGLKIAKVIVLYTKRE